MSVVQNQTSIYGQYHLHKGQMGMCKALKKQTRSNTKTPASPKGCRSFAGMVNFVSIFCPELQKLLKPIYDLTRKG